MAASVRKRCSGNTKEIYRTPMPKCYFNKIVKQFCNFIEIASLHRCYPVNLLHIFRAPFYKNASVRAASEFGNIHRKRPVLESLFNKVACLNIVNFFKKNRTPPENCF